eukprot:6144237-Karenia_brevis.AAC.1
MSKLEGKISASFGRALSLLNSDLSTNIQDTVHELEEKYERRFSAIESKQKAMADIVNAHQVLHDQYATALDQLKEMVHHQAQQIAELYTSHKT